MNKRVAIMMGSDSDLPTVEKATDIFKQLDVAFDIAVLSAHRTPDQVSQHIKDMEAEGVQIFICAAGGAAHLAGTVAGKTLKPVIGIPIKTSSLGGQDSLLSTVQMPAGIPVATTAIGNAGAANAALLACQILSLSDSELAQRMADHRQQQAATVLEKNKKVRAEFNL